jgi:hypothetical protein
MISQEQSVSNNTNSMKRTMVSVVTAIAGAVILSGCVAAIGNRDGRHSGNATIGQQLVDLQKAKEAGALTDAEFASEKAKLLESK